MMVYAVNGQNGRGQEVGACKGPSHKKEESTRSKVHRARYPKQRAARWAISSKVEKLPIGQYLGKKGRGQELTTERDGVKA
jgi:hypothetical protein